MEKTMEPVCVTDVIPENMLAVEFDDLFDASIQQTNKYLVERRSCSGPFEQFRLAEKQKVFTETFNKANFPVQVFDSNAGLCEGLNPESQCILSAFPDMYQTTKSHVLQTEVPLPPILESLKQDVSNQMTMNTDIKPANTGRFADVNGAQKVTACAISKHVSDRRNSKPLEKHKNAKETESATIWNKKSNNTCNSLNVLTLSQNNQNRSFERKSRPLENERVRLFENNIHVGSISESLIGHIGNDHKVDKFKIPLHIQSDPEEGRIPKPLEQSVIVADKETDSHGTRIEGLYNAKHPLSHSSSAACTQSALDKSSESGHLLTADRVIDIEDKFNQLFEMAVQDNGSSYFKPTVVVDTENTGTACYIKTHSEGKLKHPTDVFEKTLLNNSQYFNDKSDLSNLYKASDCSQVGTFLDSKCKRSHTDLVPSSDRLSYKRNGVQHIETRKTDGKSHINIKAVKLAEDGCTRMMKSMLQLKDKTKQFSDEQLLLRCPTTDHTLAPTTDLTISTDACKKRLSGNMAGKRTNSTENLKNVKKLSSQLMQEKKSKTEGFRDKSSIFDSVQENGLKSKCQFEKNVQSKCVLGQNRNLKYDLEQIDNLKYDLERNGNLKYDLEWIGNLKYDLEKRGHLKYVPVLEKGKKSKYVPEKKEKSQCEDEKKDLACCHKEKDADCVLEKEERSNYELQKRNKKKSECAFEKKENCTHEFEKEYKSDVCEHVMFTNTCNADESLSEPRDRLSCRNCKNNFTGTTESDGPITRKLKRKRYNSGSDFSGIPFKSNKLSNCNSRNKTTIISEKSPENGKVSTNNLDTVSQQDKQLIRTAELNVECNQTSVLTIGKVQKQRNGKLKTKIENSKGDTYSSGAYTDTESKQIIIEKVHKAIANIHKNSTKDELSNLKSNINVGSDRSEVDLDTLETMIPLDTVHTAGLDNDRKVKLLAEQQKGVLLRRHSSNAIWESVVSKYK